MIGLVHVSGLITGAHSGSSALIHHHPLTFHCVSHHLTMILLHEKFLLHVMVRHLSQVVLNLGWTTIRVNQRCRLSRNRVASFHVLGFNLAFCLCCSCMGTLLVFGCLPLGFLLHCSFHGHLPGMLFLRVWTMMMLFFTTTTEKPSDCSTNCIEKLAVCVSINGSISISF